MKKKIYCFLNVKEDGEGPAYALGEDGVLLGSHYCSCEGFVKGDLGVIEGTRPDRHKVYAKHFPEGYEMVFVPISELATHEGVEKAYQLHLKLCEEGKLHREGDNFHKVSIEIEGGESESEK